MTPRETLSSNGIFNTVLDEFYVRLGEPLLLPIGEDGKPLANPKSFAETQNEHYLRRLAESGLAVRLGPDSGHLYAVSIGTNEAVREFVRDNPSAASTLIIQGATRLFYLFTVEGYAPPTTEGAQVAWLGAGEIVPLRVKRGATTHPMKMFNRAPGKMAFGDFLWPDDLRRQLIPRGVAALYGEPFVRPQRYELNYSFWALRLATDMGVEYSEDIGEFVVFETKTGTWKTLSTHALEVKIMDYFSRFSGQPGYERLQGRIQDAERRKLITEMKVVASGYHAGLMNTVQHFCDECIEKHSGSSVTTSELYAAYGQFCESKRLSKLDADDFQRRLPKIIESSFGAKCSHSIARRGGHLRGFRKLRLKLSMHQVPDEGTKATAA